MGVLPWNSQSTPLRKQNYWFYAHWKKEKVQYYHILQHQYKGLSELGLVVPPTLNRLNGARTIGKLPDQHLIYIQINTRSMHRSTNLVEFYFQIQMSLFFAFTLTCFALFAKVVVMPIINTNAGWSSMVIFIKKMVYR